MPTTWTTSPKRHSPRFPPEDAKDALASSLSSGLSSDDEDVEKVRGRAPVYLQRTSEKSFSRKIDRTRRAEAYQENNATRYNSTSRRLHFQDHFKDLDDRLSPFRPEDSGKVYVTTMDEDDQQIFIALFYWRRKLIEAHFSAWKSVVLSLRRSAKQIHRHGINTRPNKSISMGYDSPDPRPTRRNLVHKGHTGDGSEKDDSGDDVKKLAQNKKPSTRGNDSKCLRKIDSLPFNDTLEDSRSTEKRRQFRTKLRLVYSSFSRWKINADLSRKQRVQQLIQALEFRRAQQLTTSFRALKAGSKIQKLKKKRQDDADQFYRNHIKCNLVLKWKRCCRIEREIARRQRINAGQRKRVMFQQWCQCNLQTRKCHLFAAKRCQTHLRLVFKSFQEGLVQSKRAELTYLAAMSLYQNRLQLSMLRLWREVIFEDSSYVLSIDYGVRISLSSGIRKWSRFMAARQKNAHNDLLADFFRYRTSLRRAVRGWGHFLEYKLRRKQLNDEVRRYFERSLTLQSIQKLRVAASANRTRRGQVRVATRWYQRKLATRTLELWATKTRRCARISMFRRNIRARILNNILHGWRKQRIFCKNLRVKQCIVSERWNGLILRRYMARWLRTLHIHSFRTSLELKRWNTNIAIHFRAWHNWSMAKMARRKIIEQQQLRNEKIIVQRVVSQWFGVTLRKKCFKRLVKLFRKKQSQHHFKSIFRLWRVHVHVCIATRKRNRDRSRLSLVEWKRICHESKDKKMAMAVATQYYSERRYTTAIKLWSLLATKRIRSRRAESRALSHYFRRIMIRSLQYWYFAARKRRRQIEFLAYRKQRRDEKALTHCLHAWYFLAHQRIQRRILEWTARQFQIKCIHHRSFNAWLDFLSVRRALKEKVFCVVATYENFLKGKLLRAWHLSTRRSIQLKQQIVLMHRTVKLKRLQSGVVQWSRFSLERQHHRKEIAMADHFYREYLMCCAMFQWQETWSQTSIIRHKEIMVTRQLHSHRLAKAVSQWHETYQHSARIRAKKTKASQFYKRKVLVQHFGLWKSYQKVARCKVSRRKLITRVCKQKLMTRMFQRWKHVSEMYKFERTQSQKADQHRLTFVLRLTFQNWRRYRNKRTLYIIAYFYRKRFLLRKVWYIWKMHHNYLAKVHQNILEINQLLRNNLIQATFVQWKSYASHHGHSQAQMNRADDHYTLWQCHRAVARLRKQARYHRAVGKAAKFGQIHGKRHVWRRWRHVLAIRHNKRNRRMLAQQIHVRNCTKRHFSAWKTLTERCGQVRKDKSDALYHISRLKMVWARWNRAVNWRQYITTMEYRRLDNLQANIFRKWRAQVQSRLEWRLKTCKAILVQKTTLRAKAWRSWLRYLTSCHEKQKQQEWVLSYYSVEVLLRRSLVSWKELVGMKQQRKEHKKLAALFNTHRLIRDGYRHWREYIGQRRLKLERGETLLYACKMLVVSRSIRRWRSRAVLLHQQHQREDFAALFHHRKRLTCVLHRLLKWRTSQKIARGLTTQAKRFRDDKAVAVCFTLWQRSHQWRVKYAHLTRIFKRNHKRDVFTHWKMYWRKRHEINEKQLQARVVHCVHVERSVVMVWRTFVHAQKLKKVARAFNTVKVLDGTFTCWKRRAHMLRQMKKMFVYQETCRVQTHFEAWKRLVAARRQMNEGLRRATMFKDGLRKLNVWQKWSVWVSIRRQERSAVEMAVGFRQRSSTRNCFAVWKGRVANWKCRRVIAAQALLHCRTLLLRQGFELLAGWRRTKLKFVHLHIKLSTRSVERRKRRAIASLKALSVENGRQRGLTKLAYRHWQRCHQQKYWGRILKWMDTIQFRKHQRIQADIFARTHLLRRCIAALQVHICHTKQLKIKVDAFRCRYFRSVADDCFYQWKFFTTFKLKLRALRRKTLQSQRCQRLQQWHRIARGQVRCRAGMTLIAVKRRRRELLTWFNHWESVCTDQWIEKELIMHHQRHAQKRRRLRCAVKALKTQLPARHERQKCKSFFIQHHKAFFLRVLKHWRLTTGNTPCDV